VPRDASDVIAGDVAEIVDRDLPWSDLSGAGVLVTGATGMLPSYAVRTLLALNDRHQLGIAVHALARSEAKARAVFGDALDRPDLHLLIGDVTEPRVMPGRLDWVLHGASPARPALHASDPVGTLRANVIGTMSLLEACRARPGCGILLMSSAEVYGNTAGDPSAGGLIDEDSYGGLDILSVRACYPEGKRAAETMAAAYSQQHGVGARIARFGHIYGPGLAPDDGRVQADFAANVATGQDIVLNSDGSATRTYTYVADAVAGMFTVLLRGADSVAYNVSDERGLVSIRELATLFTQVRPERGLKLSFTGSVGDRAVSAAKAQGLSSARLAALGWRPQVDLRTGLDRMVTAFEAAAR
jgi:nucleoside-diphosphate-sugar epimerase